MATLRRRAFEILRLGVMTTAICTLFEGRYALGVGALVNSLVAAGFRGAVYAGFRGQAPDWNLTALRSAGVDIHFRALNTTYHLTNYKPDFMLQLFGSNPDISRLCYLDPDIVITSPWSYFEEWLECGIALCEDVNSPMPAGHPRRHGWRRHLSAGYPAWCCRTEIYANGGFVGLSRSHLGFLETWRSLSVAMGEIIGGLDAAKLTGGKKFESKGFANCFDCSDQDALNAALEAEDFQISLTGKSAMAFEPGDTLMAHAAGPGKPWARNFIHESLRGNPPRRADKEYFRFCLAPIVVLGGPSRRLKLLTIRLATLICRVWRR